MRPLRGLQEPRVATREESGVLGTVQEDCSCREGAWQNSNAVALHSWQLEHTLPSNPKDTIPKETVWQLTENKITGTVS